jgi:type II secretory pathway pseudopilin PulG
MGTRASKGFTIIETTLFLAISGLLVLIMLIGTGSTVANQRYNDAVQSFKSLLQSQYSSLNSVQNARSNELLCNASARLEEGDTQQRGQSDCYIIGKYMRIDGNGAIDIYTVLATDRTYLGVEPTDSIDALKKKYNLNVSTTEVTRREMQWQTRISWPAEGDGARSPRTPRTMSILFVRSPDDGQLYTFTNSNIPASEAGITQAFLKEQMLITGNSIPGQGGRTICVDPSGWAVWEATAVTLRPYAAGAGAVAVQSNTDAANAGAGQRC